MKMCINGGSRCALHLKTLTKMWEIHGIHTKLLQISEVAVDRPAPEVLTSVSHTFFACSIPPFTSLDVSKQQVSHLADLIANIATHNV